MLFTTNKQILQILERIDLNLNSINTALQNLNQIIVLNNTAHNDKLPPPAQVYAPNNTDLLLKEEQENAKRLNDDKTT